MKRPMKLAVLTFLCTVLAVWHVNAASDDAKPAAGAKPAADTSAPANPDFPKEQEVKETAVHSTGGMWSIIGGGGAWGILVWLMLLSCSMVCVWLIIDSYQTIRGVRVFPPMLAESVREAITEGDLLKALKQCDLNPSPLANILTAGFSNVEEGYEVVQDAVSIAADKEAERMLQRVTYLSVISNMTPMLGLIGTVQGMIHAFQTLATMEAGGAQQAMLALSISHGLWATAIGLLIAVPAGIYYFFFKNRATRLILDMEALTLDLTKSLRNVEVVES